MAIGKNVILGFTGGIGRAVAKALDKRGQQIVAPVRNIDKAISYSSGLDNIEPVKGDASNYEDLITSLEGADTLYYCVNVPYQQWEIEVRKLLRTSIEACINKKVKLVFPGNVYVYGLPNYNPVNEKHPFQPNSKKGKIRVEMEKMLTDAEEKRGLKYTIIRMPDFYGPFVINGFYEKIFINALKGETINWAGDLDVPVEFIFIEDGGEAMVTAGLSDKVNGEYFNIPGYKETTAREFLTEVVNQSGQGSKIKTVNSKILVGLAGIFNSTIKEFKEMLYLKQNKLILDGTKFKKTFDTIPSTSYEEGVGKTLSWVKDFYKL